MSNKILKLDGLKELSKKEQQEINGGYRRSYCFNTQQCLDHYDEWPVYCDRGSISVKNL